MLHGECSLQSSKMFTAEIQQRRGYIFLRQLLITSSQNHDPLMFVLIMPFPEQRPSDVLLGQ